MKTSITNKKGCGQEGSPCQNPLEAVKNLVGEQLTSTAKEV